MRRARAYDGRGGAGGTFALLGAVLLVPEAVGKTPGDPAGSLLRVGSEIVPLMRRGMSVRPDAVAPSR
jgi:hypothetical protein